MNMGKLTGILSLMLLSTVVFANLETNTTGMPVLPDIDFTTALILAVIFFVIMFIILIFFMANKQRGARLGAGGAD